MNDAYANVALGQAMIRMYAHPDPEVRQQIFPNWEAEFTKYTPVFADIINHLAGYHPHFWCSKLHFFIDSVPFYNYPYTFGYLFSLGIYAEFLKNQEGFEDKYIALLRDTGSMKVEEPAMKHFGVDLTKTDF